MKWIRNNVAFNRGVHKAIVVKFNNSEKWFETSACCTTQTAKASARELAVYVGATQIEVMYKQDYEKKYSDKPIGYFLKYEGETAAPCYKFRIEHDVPEGSKRSFTYFKQSELFELGAVV